MVEAKWMFPKIGVPQNGWFIMENPMNKWMIWGYHYFWKHPNDGRFDVLINICHFFSWPPVARKTILEEPTWQARKRRPEFHPYETNIFFCTTLEHHRFWKVLISFLNPNLNLLCTK